VRSGSRYRWFVLIIFFFAMLTQQSDRLLIGTLTPAIMTAFVPGHALDHRHR
jgi:hypothetical protein